MRIFFVLVCCFVLVWPVFGVTGEFLIITQSDLNRVLEEHEKWIESKGKEGKRGHLDGVDLKGASLWEANLEMISLRKANLEGALMGKANLKKASLEMANLKEALLIETNFEEASLEMANLEGAKLWRANLKKAILKRADLNGADLDDANLKEASLMEANLKGAKIESTNLEMASLNSANLEGASLMGANLKGAMLNDANLEGAKLSYTDLNGAIFELKTKKIPNIIFLPMAINIHLLTYDKSPHSLLEIRNKSKEMGLRELERKLSYAIHNNRIGKLKFKKIKSKEIDWKNIIEYLLNYTLFELTCLWGMEPFRPMVIMLSLIFGFWGFYIIILLRKNKRNGIWRIWLKDRARADLGPHTPELLTLKWSAIWYGLYFSALSSFHIGWQEFNVGSWITKMQFQEYTFRATGWARFVSGVQSLISVYLLALSILTYFGRPFD